MLARSTVHVDYLRESVVDVVKNKRHGTHGSKVVDKVARWLEISPLLSQAPCVRRRPGLVGWTWTFVYVE